MLALARTADNKRSPNDGPLDQGRCYHSSGPLTAAPSKVEAVGLPAEQASAMAVGPQIGRSHRPRVLCRAADETGAAVSVLRMQATS